MDWAVSLFFTVVGAAFVAFGVHTRHARRSFESRATRAPGLVTDLRWHNSASTSTSSWIAYPVLRFETPDGRTVEVESSSGRSPAPAQVGDQVTVFYHPQDPTQAALEVDSVSSALYIVFIVLGTLFVLSGLGGLLLVAVLELVLPGSA